MDAYIGACDYFDIGAGAYLSCLAGKDWPIVTVSCFIIVDDTSLISTFRVQIVGSICILLLMLTAKCALKCTMSALNSVIDCLTIDIPVWVRTLWLLARNIVEGDEPEPLRIVIPGVESAFV